jgi:hypothetical protein
MIDKDDLIHNLWISLCAKASYQIKNQLVHRLDYSQGLLLEYELKNRLASELRIKSNDRYK